MIQIIPGDCREGMAGIAAESVQLVVTSPPYWGLRDYGLEPVVWGEGETEHRMVLGLEPTLDCAGWATGVWCGQCWVCHMAEVFDGVWRVLRDDGVCLINLGDSYAASGIAGPQRDTSGGLDANGRDYGTRGEQGSRISSSGVPRFIPSGLKPKDLCGQPWRVAFALQARGWYLRSAPPWIKGNPMPESAQDRPGVSHEMWFMLSKRARYFWDGEGVRKPHKFPLDTNRPRGKERGAEQFGVARLDYETRHLNPNGRNLRTADFFRQGLTDLIAETEAYLAHLKHTQANGGLLTDPEGTPAALVFNSTAYSGAHFATFSPAMIRPLIQGGTSERGCCPGCGAAWVRELATVPRGDWHGAPTKRAQGVQDQASGLRGNDFYTSYSRPTTLGWHPTCSCPRPPRRPVPCVVLDPFGGAGSVALEADRLGRDAILCEAQPEYVAMARERLTAEAPLLTTVEAPEGAVQQALL